MTHVVRKEAITLEEYADFLESWKGVRYAHSGMTRTSGIDCLHFVIVVCDWLHGWDSSRLPPVPVSPPQTSLHDKREAFRIVKFVRNRYHPTTRVWNRKDKREDVVLSPGDFLVVRNQVFPGHGLMAGPRHNTCWHSLNDPSLPQRGHVHETSLGWCLQKGLLEIFRGERILLQC